ncbi:MAG: hypothetical protein AB8B79_14500 [Granulosicoccus sp.]
MRWFRVLGIMVLVGCLTLLGACSVKPIESDRSSQRAALTRWSQCLERFGDQYQKSVSSLISSTKSICDGHRRDVLATFPEHQENQVNTILSEKTRVFTSRLVKTGLGNSAHQEARQGDL